MFGETIAVIKDIAIASAAIVGACVAVCGLSTWRKQLHGKTSFELAQRITQCVYVIRNQFQQARNDISVEPLYTQYERLNETMCSLDTALLEAEVLWGDYLKPAKQAMKECSSTYHLAFREKLDAQKEKLNLSDEEGNRIDHILYGDYDESDDFGQKIISAISEFENAMRPHLNRRA